ncbi:MAG: hypothetical protein V2I33_19290 [Kangiellaceae bacterium]|jgi:hypothetical protein|nr:hypothetical protein [Kangiellaceae bacterium]
MTLKELESIRADHEARLCRVEAEYYRKSAVLPKYAEPKPKKLDTPPPPDRMRAGVRFAEERQETEESDKAETDPLAAWGINKTSGHLFATPGAGSLMQKKKVEEP